MPESYALRLGDGLEFAEFTPTLWRLTVYHVLGVNRQVSLGYAEAFLLEYFITHPGKVVTRQELIDHAWTDRIVSQGSLNQAISNLRSVLGDDQKREIIVTVPRRGYQFNSDTLMDWATWLSRKQAILDSSEAETLASPMPGAKPAVMPTSHLHRFARHWQIPVLRGLSVILGLSLLAGVFGQYFYSWFPPYASESWQTTHSRLTLLASDQEELDSTKNFLQPLFQRIDALGGGLVLINRVHNYLELNCLHQDGSMRTLLVRIAQIQTLQDGYMRVCLK